MTATATATPTVINTFSSKDLAQLVFYSVRGIVKIFCDALTEPERERVLGADLVERLRKDGRVPWQSVLGMSLYSDCIRVIESAVMADGTATRQEVALVAPALVNIAKFFSRARKSIYGEFEKAGAKETARFLRLHQSDEGLFGGACTLTRWRGLDACQRYASLAGDRGPFETYEDLMLRLMDQILALGGTSPEEKRTRLELADLLAGRRRALEVEEEKPVEDRRLRVFVSSDSKEVFHATAHAHEMWDRDPYDIEEIHADARTAFARLLNRALEQEFGRTLLIRGHSGSGKTHLMRAFRSQVHGQRLGYVGYMQMTSRTENYGRYVLSKLIDSLEQPYDEPEVEDSGVLCLSNAVVERPEIAPPTLAKLREEELSGDELAALVRGMADALLRVPGLGEIDLDLLRALIYLQRRDPIIKSRVLKYLRCSELNRHDRALLDDVEPRTREEDPMRMLVGIGRVIGATGQGALVLLLDQLEDIFNLDESKDRFRRAMDVVRMLGDEIPSSIIVLSCLDDFYSALRAHLTRAVLDRIENDPPPIIMRSQRNQEEVELLVAKRLEYLYEIGDARWREDEPLFPFTRTQLSMLANQRTRDVLDWCRDYQHRCVQGGKLVAPPAVDGPRETSDLLPQVVDMEQRWNDFVAQPIEVDLEDEQDLAHTLAWAVSALGTELEQEHLSAEAKGRFVSIRKGEKRMLAGICNRAPQSGSLGKQIAETREVAGARTALVVRCSEYPSNPKTKVALEIGALIAAGGRRIVLEPSDLRTIVTLQRFGADKGKSPEWSKWLAEARPLSRVKPLRSLLALEESDHVVPGCAAPIEKLPFEIARKPELVSVPTPIAPVVSSSAKLQLGWKRALRAERVEIDQSALTSHAAFLGSTNSGKTTVALNLIEQLVLRGVPAVLVDRKGDLAGYADRAFWDRPVEPSLAARRAQLRGRIDVHVFTPGEPNGRPLGIPVIPPGLDALPAHERSKIARYAAAALCAMMGFKQGANDQKRLGILTKAVELLAETSTGKQIGISDLVALLHAEDPTLVNAVGVLDPKHFASLAEHLEALRLTRGELLETQGEMLTAELLLGTGSHAVPGKTRISVISTKFLGEKANVEFWVSRLIVEMSGWANRAPSKELQAVLLFDEADMYLPATRKPPTKEPMMDLLKRARSAGLGVFLATQSPGDLDYICRDNIRSWFIGRVAEKTAVDKMKPLLSDCRVSFADRLAGAETGSFFFVSNGAVTELKADRSVMETRQIADHEIVQLSSARAGSKR